MFLLGLVSSLSSTVLRSRTFRRRLFRRTCHSARPMSRSAPAHAGAARSNELSLSSADEASSDKHGTKGRNIPSLYEMTPPFQNKLFWVAPSSRVKIKEGPE